MHRGQIVEKIVRNSGYSITKLAKKLNVSRNTLYTRFADADLSYSFIIRVGGAIYYDFSLIIPEIKQDPLLEQENILSIASYEGESSVIWHLKGKYTKLLEKYNKLLSILLKIANRNEMHQLKNELIKLIDTVNWLEDTKDNTP